MKITNVKLGDGFWSFCRDLHMIALCLMIPAELYMSDAMLHKGPCADFLYNFAQTNPYNAMVMQNWTPLFCSSCKKLMCDPTSKSSPSICNGTVYLYYCHVVEYDLLLKYPKTQRRCYWLTTKYGFSVLSFLARQLLKIGPFKERQWRKKLKMLRG